MATDNHESIDEMDDFTDLVNIQENKSAFTWMMPNPFFVVSAQPTPHKNSKELRFSPREISSLVSQEVQEALLAYQKSNHNSGQNGGNGGGSSRDGRKKVRSQTFNMKINT